MALTDKALILTDAGQVYSDPDSEDVWAPRYASDGSMFFLVRPRLPIAYTHSTILLSLLAGLFASINMGPYISRSGIGLYWTLVLAIVVAACVATFVLFLFSSFVYSKIYIIETPNDKMSEGAVSVHVVKKKKVDKRALQSDRVSLDSLRDLAFYSAAGELCLVYWFPMCIDYRIKDLGAAHNLAIDRIASHHAGKYGLCLAVIPECASQGTCFKALALRCWFSRIDFERSRWLKSFCAHQSDSGLNIRELSNCIVVTQVSSRYLSKLKESI